MSGVQFNAGLPHVQDREQYYLFLDSLPIIVWLANEQGICKFANKAALAILGKTREQVVESGWIAFVHPDDVERISGHLAALSGFSSQKQFEVRLRDRQGEFRWFLSTMIPSTGTLGQRREYVGYAVDITESKRATEFLYRNETRYRRLFDSNLIGVMYTSIGGEILDANDKFLEMTGYSAEEIRRSQVRWTDITPPEYKAQMETNVRVLKAAGAFDPIEKQYIRKDGIRVPVLVASAFLEGSTTDAVTFVVDLTEQKRAEQATREQAELLAKGQISALNRTLALLATEPSPDAALSHVLKAITEQLSVTSSALHLINLETNNFVLHMNYLNGRITRSAAIDDPSVFNSRHLSRMTERWRNQQDGHRPPAIFDVRTSDELDESRRERLLAEGIQTLLLVPLMVHNRVVGALSLRIKERRSLSTGEIELAQALAQQASLAVQLTHLAERSRKVAILEERSLAATDHASELARANQALKQTLDILATEPEMNAVLGHVLTAITQVLEGSASSLWLRDRDAETAKLHLVFKDGHLVDGLDSGHRLAGQSVNLSRQDLFALAVFRRGRPVWHEVETSKALDETARSYLRDLGVKALLGIPLILGEQTIGSVVVRFAKSRQFGSVELELVQGLAQQATLALQLTRLAEQAREAAVTEERNRMAREIHDTLAQSFLGILIQLQAARQVLNGSGPDASPHVDSAMALARVGLAEARRSVQGLRPQLLRDGNLTTALEQLVRQFSDESVARVKFSASGEPVQMSPDIEANLLRISQEAITNAMKHSGGNEIFVRLALETDAVQLTIDDNGAGFDPHVSTLSRGFGLISMQERAERIGGELTIVTKPGAGTKIHLLVPLAHSKKAGAGHP